jgi:hypothetical protein
MTTSAPRDCSKPDNTNQRQHADLVHIVGRELQPSIRKQSIITIDVEDVLLPADLQGLNMQTTSPA